MNNRADGGKRPRQTPITVLAALRLAIAAMAGGAGEAQAEETVQERGIDCVDAAGAERPSDECALQAWTEADAELNRVYRRLRERVAGESPLAPPYTKERVLAELASIQQLWVQLRDADCELFHGGIGGGNTGHFNFLHQCHLDRTLKRIAELQALERVLAP